MKNMAKKITQKKVIAPSEQLTLEDIWSEFTTQYAQFVSWIKEDDIRYVIIEFIEDTPTKFTNKWGREQYKIRVSDIEEQDERLLCGGKRLFSTIRQTCLQENKLPTQLGTVRLERHHSGFDTQYTLNSN